MTNKLSSAKEELFSRCEFVISGHFGFNRFPAGISSTSDHVSIVEKSKLKCYLGIRKIETEGIIFNAIKMYDGAEIIDYNLGKFCQQNQKAIDFLEDELNLLDKNYGFEISIVSECSKGEGFGFTGTMMSLLISGIYCLEGKISQKDLDNYEKFQNSDLFREINNLAHKCTIIAKNGNVGSAFFSTLSEGAHPYAYITDLENELNYEKVDESSEYAKPLTELFGIKNFPMETLPVCRAIIHTGQISDSSFAVRQKKFLEYANMEYQNWFENLEISNIESQLKLGLEKSNYYETKIRNLSNLSVNMLYILEKIYKKGAQNQHVHELIRLMNLINKMYNNIEGDFDVTKDFHKSCIENGISKDTFGFSPIYTNKYGGDYLVVFEDDSDLDVLETVVEDMKNIYPDIRIRETYDFDMPAKDGIIVEQDLNHGIGQELGGDLYVLIDNQGNQKFIQYTDINPKKEKGIFFDAVKNKIYVNGKVLTSKDIKSATTTIELFEHILKSEDHSVKNNELGPSSFSGQQNQMESKIINPFVKYIKKNLGKDFPIECSGSLREFYVTLGKTDIQIQLVKKY